MADQGAGKLIKRRGHTATVLPELGREGFEFDFCYIDASHAPEDVLRDAILAWPLMKSGGVIMFDDYGQHHWESETCPIALRAKSEDRKARACPLLPPNLLPRVTRRELRCPPCALPTLHSDYRLPSPPVQMLTHRDSWGLASSLT